MFESVLPENSPHRQGKVYLIIFTLICSNYGDSGTVACG